MMRRTNTLSLKLRLVISALLILAAFIALTGIALDRAYYTSSKAAVEEYLATQVYILMAATEVDDKADISMSSSLLETKFSLPSSGLYAQIMNGEQVVWKSLSTIGISTPDPVQLAKGEQNIYEISSGDATHFLMKAYGVNWQVADKDIQLTFNVQLDLNTFRNQLQTFRTSLWGGLVSMAVLLLISFTALLYWGLLPLKRVANELKRVQSGSQQTILGQYPGEINILTDNINQLIEHEHQRQSRYKNSLGDLAHSLKTPLAVIRANIETNKTKLDDEAVAKLDENVSNINNIIQYQLQRAATVGKQHLAEIIKIKPVIHTLLNALKKVNIDKNISCENTIDASIIIKMNKNDALEVFGNLLENAFKWSQKNIICAAEETETHIKIHIQDDGEGIKPEQRQTILKRGVRMDSNTPGHGIGLAIVQDILSAYTYQLEISRGELQGAKFTVIVDK